MQSNSVPSTSAKAANRIGTEPSKMVLTGRKSVAQCNSGAAASRSARAANRNATAVHMSDRHWSAYHSSKTGGCRCKTDGCRYYLDCWNASHNFCQSCSRRSRHLAADRTGSCEQIRRRYYPRRWADRSLVELARDRSNCPALPRCASALCLTGDSAPRCWESH